MDQKSIVIFEICFGILFVVLGFIIWWWSTHLLWILIYPPPLAKQFINNLPFIYWGISILLFVDSVRRIKKYDF
jgi:hypothetical protein